MNDAIVPASCPAATRELIVRSEADEAGISRRAEATETVILVTTSRNRTESRASRDADSTDPHSIPRIRMQDERNPSIL